MFGAGCECCELSVIILWILGGIWAGEEGVKTEAQADKVDCANHDFARQAGQADHLLPVSLLRSPLHRPHADD